MTNIHEQFHTEARAFAFMRDYVEQFRPGIYGTKLSKRRSRDGQLWEVVGSRFN